MAEYTIELGKAIEMGNILFDFHYEFYDENKRPKFETDFLRHFYFREIGAETFDRFKHNLIDKFQTVFPYYNSLFNAAQIEYNVLDNYNIKEEYTITRESSDKSRGESFSVGQVQDEQTTNVDSVQDTESKIISSADGEKTETEITELDGTKTTEGNEKSVTDETSSTTEGKTINENGSTTDSESVTGTSTTSTSKTGEKNNEEIKKFLDTPQGLLNLDNTDYLTNLTQIEGSESTTENINESGEKSEEKTANGTSEKDTVMEGSSSTTGKTTENKDTTGSEITSGTEERTLNGTTHDSETTDGTGKVTGNTVTNFNGEQKSTLDNNTRRFSEGSQVEKSVYTKRGNIGVDTDSDMIQKHIALQKVLKKIEKMFFDECEDLFMLVY